ncbi:uncharacterized protein LOC123269809 [Cotesia glomerata]|uniref:CHHC U11-48K-type domain-containing protein n=1 Tax=Cotesia glomerata TaxID=32391 RepID=A0AAV7J2K7_COTGL|nr:uncharacterized protein LOC123269809 [Cotesia glomerata]KAH0566965.1 hypothetical protein KQX54_005768 [Cotesia glomerata]
MQRELDSVICPYDRSHIIDRSRLQRHLVKCSKNFPPNYKETCPFNATHLMSESELKIHIKNCPDRKYIDHDQFRFVLKNHGSINSLPPSIAESSIDHYDESWNDCLSDAFTATSIVSENSDIVSPMPKLRKPKGRSEICMVEYTEESNAEDIDSVVSSAYAQGRGKFIQQRQKAENLSRVGRRLKPITDDLEMGASAITDVEDTESVVSFVNGVGRGQIYGFTGRKYVTKYDSDTDDSRSTISTIGRGKPFRL